MTVDELRAVVETTRDKLKNNAGKIVSSSESGPIGIRLIDSIVAVLEAQQQQIDSLEKRIKEHGKFA